MGDSAAGSRAGGCGPKDPYGTTSRVTNSQSSPDRAQKMSGTLIQLKRKTEVRFGSSINGKFLSRF